MGEEIELTGMPLAGSPEIRAAISNPMGITDMPSTPSRASDVDYDEMINEMQHGRYNHKTQRYE
jgi:hypothetical protein